MVNFGHFTQSADKITESTCQLPADTSLTRRNLTYLAVIFVTTIAGCTSSDPNASGFYDPLEPTNRAIHSFNKGVDTIALRPISRAYGAITPDPVENMVENAGDNLGAPADAINQLLQGDLVASATMTGRFLINSTVGILGFFDPAEAIGLEETQTDFGKTLGTWGVSEGAYVELPLLGPSTVRNATGRVVDFFLDPVNTLVKSPESDYISGAKVLDIIDTRHRYGAVVDQALYGSADSYAAARNAYLQSTRTVLKGQTDEDDLEDPFAFE